MLREKIGSTALTTSRADEYFRGKIEADSFRDDVSMAATCRMLFGPRLAEKEKISVRFSTIFWSGSLDEGFVRGIVDGLHEGNLHIVGVTAQKDHSGAWMDPVRRVVEGKGLYEMDDVMKWFADNKTKTLVLTDKPHDPKVPKSPVDNTKSIVFVENLSMMRWHTLEVMLKRLLGKWFENKPMTKEEMDGIVNALYKDNVDAYLEAAQKYVQTLDLRSGFIKRSLCDFEKKHEKDRMQQLESQIQQFNQKIEEANRNLGRILTQREELIVTLHGYRNGNTDDEPYVMNYFLANKNLFLKNATGDYLDFYTMGWFTNWDPEVAEATFGKNHMGSWLEYNKSFDVPDADAKLLYKALFLEEAVKVRLWSHFRLNLRGDSPARIIGHEMRHDEITNAIPNPHHQYHSCLGNNTRLINEAMMGRDVVSAIEQCFSATKGINLMEHASYQYFTKDLFDPNNGAIIYVNEVGQFMTTKDAIAYLKDKSHGKKTQKEEA